MIELDAKRVPIAEEWAAEAIGKAAGERRVVFTDGSKEEEMVAVGWSESDENGGGKGVGPEVWDGEATGMEGAP